MPAQRALSSTDLVRRAAGDRPTRRRRHKTRAEETRPACPARAVIARRVHPSAAVKVCRLCRVPWRPARPSWRVGNKRPPARPEFPPRRGPPAGRGPDPTTRRTAPIRLGRAGQTTRGSGPSVHVMRTSSLIVLSDTGHRPAVNFGLGFRCSSSSRRRPHGRRREPRGPPRATYSRRASVVMNSRKENRFGPYRAPSGWKARRPPGRLARSTFRREFGKAPLGLARGQR